jgi:hypothetical protein
MQRETIDVKVGDILNDLTNGLTRQDIQKKYNLTIAQRKTIFSHPKLKFKKTKTAEVIINLIDDTEPQGTTSTGYDTLPGRMNVSADAQVNQPVPEYELPLEEEVEQEVPSNDPVGESYPESESVEEPEMEDAPEDENLEEPEEEPETAPTNDAEPREVSEW